MFLTPMESTFDTKRVPLSPPSLSLWWSKSVRGEAFTFAQEQNTQAASFRYLSLFCPIFKQHESAGDVAQPFFKRGDKSKNIMQ